MRRAVLDVGSNSVLLLVAEELEGIWTPILERTSVTALGEGTKETGVLSEDAMTRTLAAIAEFAGDARDLGATEVRIGVTMAARIAQNRQDFIDRAAAQGTPLRVLTGIEEAQLGFESIVSDPIFATADRVSIVDPGGHSTELVTADRTAQGWEVHYRNSFPIGTLAMKSTCLPNEQSDGLAVLRATAELDDCIGLCYRPNSCGEVAVLGAAGTNLITIREAMPDWDPDAVHGQVLTYEEVSRSVGHLMPLTDAERAAIVGMEKGREKTIHLGALILERFLFALRAEYCRVSVRGWRHALLEKESWDSI